MVFNRQKERAVANPESPAITHPGKNMREVRTLRRTVFTQEHNELFIKRVLQYSQEDKSDKLYYLVLGLNEYSTEDDIKNYIVPSIFNFTLIEISIHKFLI